ncbi:zinc finger-like domain-containing protein [Streptomyces caniscabiei]|uniref:Uncharacterized protein n=1 Tax=Streptomyces caniscabiei TaxID=2746961 RepID=A0A927KYA3_9ACTN|nr:zinc finger-like domain-containing protein [Streptomyces caniscabiei]MBD9721954.1 hypothetical protein [Streptomyces caniscabiei]MDX3509146.1 zinc finger-like domain-containing protein [Streptomyces caniscabiei]MDX3717101.1 zinc finger-like domain-containing protein [Streptomyces caniscabiei]WEO22969.1 zinc finger-like domain-containing protein [Streptomyces caniscabiei]
MLTLKIQQMTVDGHPYTCPECASEAFTLDGAGWIDAVPVWGNCWQAHSWEEPLITLGDLKQIKAASTGRERAEDVDTFQIVIGGARLAGVLHPEVTVDDIKRAVRDVYWGRLLKPALRRRKNKAIRAVTRPVKRGARNAVASAKAAAIGAAWDLQAGGHETDPDYTPEPINPCPACNGRGRFNIDTHLHNTTNVRCAVCSGTGEID